MEGGDRSIRIMKAAGKLNNLIEKTDHGRALPGCCGIGPVDAINRMMVRTRGSYALALMFRDYPGEIYAARKDSPMIIGTDGEESFLASDVTAMLSHTRKVYYIGNLQAARLLPGEVHFFDLNGDEIALPASEVVWDAKAAGKKGFRHYMMKEIHEQPDAVRYTLESVIRGNQIDFTASGLTDELLKSFGSICIAACGSAWHVGMAAGYIIEDLAEVPVRVELASEYRYRKNLHGQNSLLIVISQSGETADTLAALRIAKENGIRTPVIGVLTQGALLEKTISNMKECKAMGAYLIGITDSQSEAVKAGLDFELQIPGAEDHFMGILAVIPLQLLGYYISVARGLDVDKPRNLAKSVTVE